MLAVFAVALNVGQLSSRCTDDPGCALRSRRTIECVHCHKLVPCDRAAARRYGRVWRLRGLGRLARRLRARLSASVKPRADRVAPAKLPRRLRRRHARVRVAAAATSG